MCWEVNIYVWGGEDVCGEVRMYVDVRMYVWGSVMYLWGAEDVCGISSVCVGGQAYA